MKFFILFIAIFSASSFAEHFDLAPYISECGGKIYPKCNSSELNQGIIFEKARQRAIEQNKSMMVVFGANWCPACHTFQTTLKKDPDAPRLFERFLVVEINGDISSGKKLFRDLNITIFGYPSAVILNPNTRKASQQMHPSTFSDLKSLLTSIGSVPEKKTPPPAALGEVSLNTLSAPIDLIDNYGLSQFVHTPKNKAEKYVNQGVAALHVFHYVDAFRSFQKAQLLDKDLVWPHIGMALSALNMNYKTGQYYAEIAIAEIKKIEQKKSLTPFEREWTDFLSEYSQIQKSNYLIKREQIRKPLHISHNEIINIAPNNFDSIALATWLSISTRPISKSRNILERYILSKQPQNIGALHYLVHLAEFKNDTQSAFFYGEKLAQQASKAPHAIHMYGHTLPQQGKWKEALKMFKKAHQLHLKWANENNFDPKQDWHYAHNLDLMAAVYLGLGHLEKAKKIWWDSFSDQRGIIHYFQAMLLSQPKKESQEILTRYINHYDHKFLPQLLKEVELSKSSAKDFEFFNTSGDKKLSLIVKSIIKAHLAGKPNPELSVQLSHLLVNKLKKGGFDGWSNAYLDLLRIKRITKILSIHWVQENLEIVDFNVKAGSLCSTKSKNGSPTPCFK